LSETDFKSKAISKIADEDFAANPNGQTTCFNCISQQWTQDLTKSEIKKLLQSDSNIIYLVISYFSLQVAPLLPPAPPALLRC